METPKVSFICALGHCQEDFRLSLSEAAQAIDNLKFLTMARAEAVSFPPKSFGGMASAERALVLPPQIASIERQHYPACVCMTNPKMPFKRAKRPLPEICYP